MTGRVRILVVLLLFAVLFACVLSTAVVSGEHPWGSDGRRDSTRSSSVPGDTTSVGDVSGRTGSGMTATADSDARVSSVDWVQRFVFKAALKYAQWIHWTKGPVRQADR